MTAAPCAVKGCTRPAGTGALCGRCFRLLPKRRRWELTNATRAYLLAPSKEEDFPAWLRAWKRYSAAVTAAKKVLDPPETPVGVQTELFHETVRRDA